MAKPFIFISCGQFTEAEKQLGKRISQMVREITGLDPFFAEEVQDLNGLDSNILRALHDCAAFITVLHPRGTIGRPGNEKPLIRASVWIEQEIAIATYIQRIENRKLPIIAFKHRSVDREGIRSLIHLNPIDFDDESEVLTALRVRLTEWKQLATAPIVVQLDSTKCASQDGHPIRKFRVWLINDTNERIAKYDIEVQVPAGILRHWSSKYMYEAISDDPSRRRFRFNEEGRNILNPHDKLLVYTDDYCAKCALDGSGNIPDLVTAATVEVKVWIANGEYSTRKTIEELADE